MLRVALPRSLAALAVAGATAACAAPEPGGDGAEPSAVVPANASAASGDLGDPTADADSVPVTDTLVRVCGTEVGVYQRSGPGTTYAVLRTVPEGNTVRVLRQVGDWIENDWSGRPGWSSARYLCPVTPGSTEPGDDIEPSLVAEVTPRGALAIARAAVGAAYWWGGAAFTDAGGASACYGACPSCAHEGQVGADCSGFLAKVWQLPAALPMGENKHPYRTAHFAAPSAWWRELPRSEVRAGDAMVTFDGERGHVFLYEGADPWGLMWTYEARSCGTGVVHNLRSAGPDYRALRRTGFESVAFAAQLGSSS
jgi:hypothetical protein